jgi:hypothetical protein
MVKNLLASALLLACGLIFASAAMGQSNDENRLKALVRSFYHANRNVLSGQTADAALSGDANAADISEGSKKELDKNQRLQQRLTAQKIRYENGQVKDVRFGQVSVNGDAATVKASAVYNFKIKAGVGAPEFTEYEEAHTFTFSKNGNRWVLTGAVERPYGDVPNTLPPDAPVDKNALPKSSLPSMQEGGSPADRPKPNRPNQGDTTRRGPNASVTDVPYVYYDRNAAAAYARRYALNYNTSYKSFTNDCTNFISQALYAGGWTYTGSEFSRTSNTTWYYGSLSQSYTWAGAHNHYLFHANMDRSWIAEQSAWLIIGEPINIDFEGDGHIDHTVIITKVDSYNNQYVSYHTTNSLDKPLSYFFNNYPNAKYYGWMMHDYF